MEAALHPVRDEQRQRHPERHEVVVEHIRRRQQHAGEQRRALEPVFHGAAPHPHASAEHAERDQRLQAVGELQRAAPKSHPGKDALEFLKPGISRFHDDFLRQRKRIEEGLPHRPAPERKGQRNARQHGRGGGGDGAPVTAGRKDEWQQQAELRLVSEQTEQDAGEDFAARQSKDASGEQRRGQEAGLPMTEADENRRKAEREDECAAPGQDGAERRERGEQ